MSTPAADSPSSRPDAHIRDVHVTGDSLIVDLADGRLISAPLSSFPRLSQASAGERGEWELEDNGYTAYWPQINEVVSVEDLLRVRPEEAPAGERPRYSMLIRWSEFDGVYIVALPEWAGRVSSWGSVTHGETYEDAARMGQEALELLMEVELEDGRPLPPPQLYADEADGGADS